MMAQNKHNINHHVSGIREAINTIRDAQRGGIGYCYIFAGHGQQWLAGGVYYDMEPPAWTEWHIAVPPDNGQPVFIYGADSCINPHTIGGIIDFVRGHVAPNEVWWPGLTPDY